MAEWTREAERRLENYLAHVHTLFADRGEEAEEIVAGLRTHIREDAERMGGAMVTPEQVERAIRSIGTPEEVAEWNGLEPAAPAQPPGKGGMALIWLGGVIIPGMALGLELLGGFMAQYYLDPIPTFLHLLLLCTVPAGSIYLIKILQRPKAPIRHSSFFVCGYLLALCGAYSAVYAVTIPLSLLAILVMGLGMFGLSPHTSFLASLGLALRLKRLQRELAPSLVRPWRTFTLGAMLALLLVGGATGRLFYINQAVRLVTSESRMDRAEGLSHLRWLRAERELLARSLTSLPRQDIFNGNFRRFPLNSEDYRRAYFLLTGAIATEEKSPFVLWARGALPNRFRQARFDRNRGGEVVGERQWNLALVESQMDFSLTGDKDGTADEAVAYAEWTMLFRNDARMAQEARCYIAMPPGGVGSRLTLWINGEEKEAAFGGKGQVRAAYQEIAVVQRRDPALLTLAGPDLLMLQCFPVPANGTMKVKVGMSAPMLIRDDKAYLWLPRIAQSNFEIEDGLEHLVWAESPAPLEADLEELKDVGTEDVFALKGAIASAVLDNAWAGALMMQAPHLSTRRFQATLGDTRAEMILSSEVTASTPPDDVWIVVDTSASMAEAEVNWNDFVHAFPEHVSLHAIAAQADVPQWEGDDRAALVRWIEDLKFRGAGDPIPALTGAWLEAVPKDGWVIWIHGPLPFDVSSNASLEQALNRRPPGAQSGIYHVAAVAGPNRVVENFGWMGGLRAVSLVGGVQANLERLATAGLVEEVQRSFRLLDLEAPPVVDAEEASEHVVRLAVNDAIAQELAMGNDTASNELIQLAAAHRLVTPVSGAVVLEQRQQYERHGLNPNANRNAIAAIPEPEEWALIIIAVASCLFAAVLHRRRGSIEAH